MCGVDDANNDDEEPTDTVLCEPDSVRCHPAVNIKYINKCASVQQQQQQRSDGGGGGGGSSQMQKRIEKYNRIELKITPQNIMYVP